MEHNSRGRVVGAIHLWRTPPDGAMVRPMFYPQSLRLVARPDKHMERVIENALALFALRGHTEAINYLTTAHVPLRTISRVLWKPQQRRHSDP